VEIDLQNFIMAPIPNQALLQDAHIPHSSCGRFLFSNLKPVSINVATKAYYHLKQYRQSSSINELHEPNSLHQTNAFGFIRGITNKSQV